MLPGRRFCFGVAKTKMIVNCRILRALVKTFKGPIRLHGCEILSFHWIRETAQIKVIIVRPNFHVNISEQFASASGLLSKGQ